MNPSSPQQQSSGREELRESVESALIAADVDAHLFVGSDKINHRRITVDSILALIDQYTNTRVAEARVQGRIDECFYVREYLHLDANQPSHVNYGSKRLYDLQEHLTKAKEEQGEA